MKETKKVSGEDIKIASANLIELMTESVKNAIADGTMVVNKRGFAETPEGVSCYIGELCSDFTILQMPNGCVTIKGFDDWAKQNMLAVAQQKYEQMKQRYGEKSKEA